MAITWLTVARKNQTGTVASSTTIALNALDLACALATTGKLTAITARATTFAVEAIFLAVDARRQIRGRRLLWPIEKKMQVEARGVMATCWRRRRSSLCELVWKILMWSFDLNSRQSLCFFLAAPFKHWKVNSCALCSLLAFVCFSQVWVGIE